VAELRHLLAVAMVLRGLHSGFFRTRDQGLLIKCKKVERVFDDKARQLLTIDEVRRAALALGILDKWELSEAEKKHGDQGQRG
jgi:hypothetical protein